MDYKHKYINILIIREDHPTRILPNPNLINDPHTEEMFTLRIST